MGVSVCENSLRCVLLTCWLFCVHYIPHQGDKEILPDIPILLKGPPCLPGQARVLSLSSLRCISALTLMHRDLFSSCSNQVPFPVWDSSLEGIGFFFLSLSASFSENGPVWTSGLQEFFWKFLWINVLIPLYFHMRKILANIYSLGFTNSLPKG